MILRLTRAAGGRNRTRYTAGSRAVPAPGDHHQVIRTCHKHHPADRELKQRVIIHRVRSSSFEIIVRQANSGQPAHRKMISNNTEKPSMTTIRSSRSRVFPTLARVKPRATANPARRQDCSDPLAFFGMPQIRQHHSTAQMTTTSMGRIVIYRFPVIFTPRYLKATIIWRGLTSAAIWSTVGLARSKKTL